MNDVAAALVAMNDSLPAPRATPFIPHTLYEPSRAVVPLAPSDPARLGYPPTFPIELALRTSSTRAICEAYGIEEDEWNLIRVDPTFLADLDRAVKVVAEEGMSFKLKAKLQAEELLKTSWRMIHDPNTPPQTRADLLKSTMRWAEYDVPPQKQDAPGTNRGSFTINMQFNNAALSVSR